MIIIKGFILLSILITSSLIGIMFANKYKERVNDLKEIKRALNIFKTKIEYTYKPLPIVFSEIAEEFNGGVGEIFKIAEIKMKEESADMAWEYAINNSKTSMKREDLVVLENLKKMLGKTNIEGQLSEIDLIQEFIEEQINLAEGEQQKNEKLYRSLGIIAGIAIVIILI